ncbi:hypothetical protein HIM_01006 [Hirsutella minnesotensis 3608]|nr:hypothetical protein HIM_01006 [Hirsutella minnesotensis 3608]
MKFVPQHLKHAFDACALTSLNNRPGSRDKFASEPLQLYIKGLLATYSALRDPKIATQDATLAFIFLAFFENITATRVTQSLRTGQIFDMNIDWWMEDTARDPVAFECQRLTFLTAQLKATLNSLLSAPRSSDQIGKHYQYWGLIAGDDNIRPDDFAQDTVYPGRIDTYQDLWVREWVRSRLDYIGTQLGVRLALTIKQLKLQAP